MDRSTYSTGRIRNSEQNINSLDLTTNHNKLTSTSSSQNQAVPPILRNSARENEVKLYPFFQQDEYKYKDLLTSSEANKKIVVELRSCLDEKGNDSFKIFFPEPTLRSRPSLIRKKHDVSLAEGRSISFFQHMPEDIIRNILFEHMFDLNDDQTTAKNLIKFAGISKFNREFVRKLLTEEDLHERSFDITKLAIPTLLARLANDKKAKFTQADIDDLVRNWPYLTMDCSYKKNLYSDRGLEALKKIVAHPELKGLRIINNMPDKIGGLGFEYHKQNDKNINLIYSLLSRKDKDVLKIDINFKNWVPPQVPLLMTFDKYYEPIKKIQAIATKCGNLEFGELNLSRNIEISLFLFHVNQKPWANQKIKYQHQFVKMMCNIAVSHSVHTISLAGLKFVDEDLALIINEIKNCNKSNLQHLDLSGNDIDESAAESLSTLLQSENTCLKTLELSHGDISENAYNILAVSLKNNHSLELVDIKNVFSLVADHPIKNDKRVRLTE